MYLTSAGHLADIDIVGQGLLSLAAGKGRGGMFLFLLFFHFLSFPSFSSPPIPLFHLLHYLIYLFSPFLWEMTQNDPQTPTLSKILS